MMYGYYSSRDQRKDDGQAIHIVKAKGRDCEDLSTRRMDQVGGHVQPERVPPQQSQ